MKYLLLRLKRFCGFIAGFVFFIAGIFKLLDPVGAGLVMKEYMDFLHVGFLAGAAKPIAVAFALIETLVGAALVTGVWRKLMVIIALVLQGMFTILTLVLVVFNPEMDCGCFGEVIHLTHLQTFIKNLVLMLLLVLFAFPMRHLGTPKKLKYVSFCIVSLSVLAFAAYSWINIPFVDYTAFKPAAALQAGSAFGTPKEDVYEAVFIYQKEGEIKEFTLESLPDSTWTFVDTKTVVKDVQVENSVCLSFYDDQGLYYDTLATKGKVLVMSIYDADARNVVWDNAALFISLARESGFTPLLLVSSTDEVMEAVFAEHPELQEILRSALYFSDYKTLVALNRSNAGVTYFSDGYLIRKWASRACPDKEELENIYVGDETETIIGSDANGSLAFQGFLLYVFAVMLLL